MSSFQRIVNIVAYEWRRALAKKKFYILIALAVTFQVLPFAVYTQFPTEFLPEQAKATMWIAGVLGPQALFIQIIAIVTAGSSMSEEYEQGTADILLSKPISRVEYMVGKYLGGFSLMALVEVVTTALGVVLALGFFGSQENLQVIPALYGGIVYSSLLFFSLAFMLSEVSRRSTLSMLTMVSVLVTSLFIASLLSVLYFQTHDLLYVYIARALPNWAATNFPAYLVRTLIDVSNNPFVTSDPTIALRAMMEGIPEADLILKAFQLSAAIIAAYAAVSILIATMRLVKSDVTKKFD